MLVETVREPTIQEARRNTLLISVVLNSNNNKNIKDASKQ